MKSLFLNIALTAVLAITAFSCAPIEYESQDISAFHNADADTLVVELRYNGIEAAENQTTTWTKKGIVSKPDGDDLEGGEAIIRRMANGQRLFMLAFPFMVFDLDEEKEQPGPDASELDRKNSKFMDGITVEDARFFLDQNRHLTAAQRLMIPNFSQGVAIANILMREDFLRNYDEGNITTLETPFDADTIKLAHQDALSGYNWIRWTQAGLEFSIPASPALLAKALTESLRAMGETSDEESAELIAGSKALAMVLAPLSELTIKDDHVVFLFRPDSNGCIKIHFPAQGFGVEKAEYSPTLQDYLIEKGMTLPAEVLNNSEHPAPGDGSDPIQ